MVAQCIGYTMKGAPAAVSEIDLHVHSPASNKKVHLQQHSTSLVHVLWLINGSHRAAAAAGGEWVATKAPAAKLRHSAC
jgi:hypothetical protein